MVHHKVAEGENALHHVVQKHGCKLLRQDLYRYVAVSESVLGWREAAAYSCAV